MTETDQDTLEELFKLLEDVHADTPEVSITAALTHIRNSAYDSEQIGLAICMALARIVSEVKEYYIAVNEAENATKH